MEFNMDLVASCKAGKPYNHNKAVGLSGNPADSKFCFKSILSKAEEKNSKSNLESDSSIALKNKPPGNYIAKLRIKGRENDKPVEESKEKETDIKGIKTDKDMTIEEILCALQRLANMKDPEGIPAGGQIVLPESIEELLKELVEIQTGSIAPEASDIHVKLEELMSVLEGIPEEPEAYGSSAGKETDSDFIKELKAIAEEISVKTGTASKKSTNDSVLEQLMGQTDTNAEELKMSSTAADDDPYKEASVQKSGENDDLTAESNMAKISEEKQKTDAKNEVPNTGSKPVRDSRPEAGENEDEIKEALDSKVEKATIEVKEGNDGQNRHEGTEDSRKTAKEINKATYAVKNKPVNEEITVLKQEQTVTENKQELIQNQAAAPKTQTVNKGVIINQIVKKAEIIVNDSQQEMRMQLEPENLGKLTLKVAVERGLITAKFVAESYEVKQIIESSFNELKDMLFEKGLAIQSLSVSVGQDKKKYYSDNNFEKFKEKVKLNVRSMSSVSYYGYTDGAEILAGKANPYSIHIGEFDHRA